MKVLRTVLPQDLEHQGPEFSEFCGGFIVSDEEKDLAKRFEVKGSLGDQHFP